MKRNEKLELRRSKIKPENKEFVRKSFEISDMICDILEKRGISQKEFARLLEKNESEISKWLRGTHNFTLSTIAKIESVLGKEIITIKKYKHRSAPESSMILEEPSVKKSRQQGSKRHESNG